MYRNQTYKNEITVEGFNVPLPIVSEYPLVFDLLDLQDNPEEFLPTLLSTFYTYFLPSDLYQYLDDEPFKLTDMATYWFSEVVQILVQHPRLEGIEEKIKQSREAKTSKDNLVGKPKSMVQSVTDRAKDHIGKNRFNIITWVSWLAEKSDFTSKEINAMCWQEFIELSNTYQAFADVEFAQQEAEKKKQELAKNKANQGR